jgi:hypothetical protein
VGETIHIYEHGRVVCDLCRGRWNAAPERSELMLHAEQGQTVRLVRTAAATPHG